MIIGDSDNQAASISNGNEVQSSEDQNGKKCESDVSRQPSYVSLACCISGYSTLHYDSKQRQALRSLSPSRPLNNGNQNSLYKSECGNYLSPACQEPINKMPIDGKGVDVMTGYDSLSSPRHVPRMSVTSESRRNFTSSMISENYSYTTSSSHYSSYSSPTSMPSASKTEFTNGSRLIPAMKAPSQVSPSSFIVQRVERLYGPGALAQGFYSPRRVSSLSKETKGNNSVGTVEKIDDSLPVLKLLRPEFRAQLTLASRKSKSPEAKLTTPLTFTNGSSLEMASPNTENEQADSVDATIIEKTKELSVSEIKDGHYFLKLLDEKVLDLEKLAVKAEEELAHCDNEEGEGMLRSISGKTHLLVAEKLNQFRGLCYKNLKQTEDEDFPTTNEDLAGFWDMVLLQVTAVLAHFQDIEEMKKNNWRPLTPKLKMEDTPKRSGAMRKLAPRKLNEEPKVSAASKARNEARRKMIEERRKAMRNLKPDEEDSVIIV